jgi:hypothetical protein
MVPTITTLSSKFAAAALIALGLLCLSAAILRADEGHSAKHCRMYFGCVPDLAKQRGPFN